MNYAVRTERANTEKYVESAARGMPNCKLTNYETVVGTTDFDKVVFMGVLRGTHLVYKHCQSNKKDLIFRPGTINRLRDHSNLGYPRLFQPEAARLENQKKVKKGF